MKTNPGILIVESDPVLANTLQQQLAAHGYHIVHAANHDDALQTLHQQQAQADDQTIGVVLIDQDAGAQSAGLALIRRLHDDWPRIVPIMTSAFRKIESAVTAMRLGAADYLLKPIIKAELLDAVGRAMQRHLLMVEQETAQQEIASPEVTSPQALPPESGNEATFAYTGVSLSEAMKAPERHILLAALKANDWNRGQTAKQLDINRTTLYKKIRQYKLDEPA